MPQEKGDLVIGWGGNGSIADDKVEVFEMGKSDIQDYANQFIASKAPINMEGL